jgi:hypothetical protein
MPLRWKNYLFIVIAGLLISSCALTKPYQAPHHSVYAKILTPYEKTLINQKGEITKDIELYDPLDMNLWKAMLKGTLRILRTDDPEVFNFVEIGPWVTMTRGGSHLLTSYHIKDTTLNDSLGNTLSKVVYYEDRLGKYSLGKKYTSSMIHHQFIQHVQLFIDTALVSEFDMKVLDYDIPKSDSQKRKITVGVSNDYWEGKLVRTRMYDNEGNLIKERKWE